MCLIDTCMIRCTESVEERIIFILFESFLFLKFNFEQLTIYYLLYAIAPL